MHSNSLTRSGRLRQRLFVVAAALLAVVLSGCVTVDVINVSDLSARVQISLPDAPAGYTRFVRSGESTSTFSTYGGRVTITVLPDEQYRTLLTDVGDQISRRLWDERDSLSAEDIALLVQRLNDVQTALDNLADDGDACTVHAPDFSAVTAVLVWDSTQDKWSLDCGVATDEEI